jgi:glycosyltransferase involved in cell wall biosynthesis
MTRLGFAIDGGGGNLTYQRNLAAALRGVDGVESDFLTIPIAERDVWELVPLMGHNLALTASARATAALYAADRRRPLDAALIHSQSLALFAVPWMRRVPTLISTDGTPANYDSFADALDHKVYGRTIEAAKKLWTQATFSAAERILGFSQWVKNSLVNDYGCLAEKVDVIPPGIDVELWKPAPELRSNDALVRILFAGGNFERKGGPELLRWKQLSRHRDQVELHLVTKSPVPEGPGVVVHRDLVPNAPELVRLAQSCDLFVLPTRGDCFGFAVIEAQSLGLPVVVSNLGGIPEIVVEGETGYLVGRDDFDALCDRIDRLVGDPDLRRRLGAKARELAVKRFDARINSRRVLDLMLRLAGAGRS